ncbi:hypothetical protein D3C79_848170 [compost metagenome]
MGRGLPGTGPETEHRRHQPVRAQPGLVQPQHHCPVLGADVPARAVRQAVELGNGPPFGSQADPASGQQLPDPAENPALRDHRPDRRGTGVAVLRLARCGRHCHADPDLRVAGPGPEHRGRSGRPARPRLRRLLRRRRLQLRHALALPGLELLGVPADCRPDGCHLRLPARLPGAAPAR